VTAVLLDTHALLWALTEPKRLSVRARKTLADPRIELLVSAATGWEIATKSRLGKLAGAEAIVLAYDSYLAHLGVRELPITSRHATAAGALTWAHRDPFDRMLAAQAMLESVPLATADKAFAGCPGVRVLW